MITSRTGQRADLASQRALLRSKLDVLARSGGFTGHVGTDERAGLQAKMVEIEQKLAALGQATEAYAIWNEIAPLARLCWSNPLRDYRARMKYVLMRQGVIGTDVTRAPQTRVSDADRRKVDLLIERHGLLRRKYLPQG